MGKRTDVAWGRRHLSASEAKNVEFGYFIVFLSLNVKDNDSSYPAVYLPYLFRVSRI